MFPKGAQLPLSSAPMNERKALEESITLIDMMGRLLTEDMLGGEEDAEMREWFRMRHGTVAAAWADVQARNRKALQSEYREPDETTPIGAAGWELCDGEWTLQEYLGLDAHAIYPFFLAKENQGPPEGGDHE